MPDPGRYVLGTDDDEQRRLGLQHRVWRGPMLRAWRRGGIATGTSVVDVGAGPGHASIDLAELVGPTGRVVAVERSARFGEALAGAAVARGLRHLEVVVGDLMEIPARPGHAVAWCRWVASFVPDVDRLVRWIRDSLEPGGRAVFHEYLDYGTWTFAPARPSLGEFVAAVIASWGTAGGRADVAVELMARLGEHGFRIRSTRPLIFAVDPSDVVWEWPAAFVRSYAPRLAEAGVLTGERADRIVAELAAAEADPSSRMITPMVLEVVAERIG
jgi:SAM-dependent methyltransferase